MADEFDEDVAPRAAAAAASSTAFSSVGSFGGLTADDDDGTGSKESNNLIARFRQMWITEKASPELLYYETDVVAEVKLAVDERSKKLAELHQLPNMKFLCDLLQMELDRINFLLHAYHRCRLKKLEKFATFIITSKQTDRCSPHELTFVLGFANLLSSHFQASFLKDLPDKMSAWFHLDTPSDDMLIVRPDVQNSFVTFRVKYPIEAYEIGEDEVISLRKDDIIVGSWKDFKELFTEGQIELL